MGKGDTLIGFILFTGTDTDTGTDEQGQVKFLPERRKSLFEHVFFFIKHMKQLHIVLNCLT